MFTKMRSLKVLFFVAILMIITVVAVAAAVDCYWQGTNYTFASATGSVQPNTPVYDNLVVYPDVGYVEQGTLKWYVCGPTNGVQPCQTGGINFSTIPLNLGKYAVVKSGDPYTITSGTFVTSTAGTYCFRVNYTDNSYSTFNFTLVGGITNTNPTTTNECFVIPSSSTAVTLSSFGAQSNSLDMSNLVIPGMSLASLFALVGLLGAGYLVRARS